jgi:hypothetical protein
MTYKTMHSPTNLVYGTPQKKPIVINLFGGAGIGKSTLAAHIFYNMKCMDINCEIVTEYAKDLVWKEAHKVLTDEVYVFAKQHHRIKMVADKVDYIVTDSPIILPIIYDNVYGDTFHEFVIDVFSGYNNANFILERKKRYNPIGRLQDEDEARALDGEIQKLLDTENIPYHVIDDPVNGWDVVKRVLDLKSSE